jgi:superfamily II DNA or RNA helicase
MEKIVVEKYNDVYIKIYCEPGTRYELQDYFTFTVPGARFMPQVRNKYWDGKIRLFNLATQMLYAGLVPYVRKFAYDRGYEVDVDSTLYDDEFSLKEAKEFSDIVLKDTKFDAREYQLEAFAHAMRTKRALLLSPTASGKSLIIYLITRAMIAKDKKILVIVPTTSLVNQMKTDFEEYGYENDIRIIMGNTDKSWRNSIDERIVISTWQSIYKMPKPWFNQFGAVMGDEAHNFKSKSLSSIMSKMDSCEYRFGFTGTLDGTLTHKLVLEGLFGAVKKVTTTEKLMKDGALATLNIKCLVLGYPPSARELLKKANYRDELDYIVTNEARNKFIENLALSLKGNTLVLFQFVEKHGKVLYDLIQKQADKEIFDRKIFFVYGATDADSREQVRAITENEDNAIIVASYGTFSTGVNIKRLHNVIFSSPTKSRIRTLQSIGRGLRTGEGKQQATLFDIADDLTWKSRKKYTLEHFAERVKYYNDEKFDYKIYQVKLNV